MIETVPGLNKNGHWGSFAIFSRNALDQEIFSKKTPQNSSECFTSIFMRSMQHD